MVVLGTDAHKRSHTVVAVDEAGAEIASVTVAATPEGSDVDEVRSNRAHCPGGFDELIKRTSGLPKLARASPPEDRNG